MAGLSIQGEQQRDYGVSRADQDDVDAYVDGVSAAVLGCRQRGHRFPPPTPNGEPLWFAMDRQGVLYRRVLCQDCRLVMRVEQYVFEGRGKNKRVKPVGQTQYVYLEGPDGERYAAPRGHGRMTRRQVTESVLSKSLSGLSITEVRKNLPLLDQVDLLNFED